MSSEINNGAPHLVENEDNGNFSGQISVMLSEALKRTDGLGNMLFLEELRNKIKDYQGRNGSLPEIDIVINMDEITKDKSVIMNHLRFFKAIIDSSRNCIRSLVVKSANAELPSMEPNVFSSGVDFEKI